MQLKINSPCQENWNNMSAVTDYSKFCKSCQKSVMDFSKYSDEQLLDFFQKKQQTANVCGRLRSDQLNRALIFTKPVNNFYNRWIAGMFGIFAFVKTSSSQNIQKRDASGRVVNEKIKETQLNIRNCRQNYFNGTVLDSKTKEPLPFVNIVSTLNKKGTISDIDGKFIVPVENCYVDGEKTQTNDTFKLSFLGYEKKDFVLPENKSSDTVYLNELPVVMMGAVVMTIPNRDSDDVLWYDDDEAEETAFEIKMKSFFQKIFKRKKSNKNNR